MIEYFLIAFAVAYAVAFQNKECKDWVATLILSVFTGLFWPIEILRIIAKNNEIKD